MLWNIISFVDNLCWVQWHLLHICKSPMFLACTLHLHRAGSTSIPRETTPVFCHHSCTSQFSKMRVGTPQVRKAQERGSFLTITWGFPYYSGDAYITRKTNSGKLFVCYNGWQQWWTVSIAWTPHCQPSPIRSINLCYNQSCKKLI